MLIRGTILIIDHLINNNYKGKSLLSDYYMPGTTLNVLDTLTELILSLKYEYYYYHFRSKELVTQRS